MHKLYKEFTNKIDENIKTHKLLVDKYNEVKKAIDLISVSLKKNSKILLCGNGGSAADAQHLAAELLVRLRPNVDRYPLPAISLAQDTSTITACGNDYDFSDIFVRTFRALQKKNDILLVISTSGNSKNIIKVLKEAKKKKIKTIGFLGSGGGVSKKWCDVKIIVPSKNVARIQECHIFLGHFIFEQVENNLIKKN
jgi:D-sedoheptulose 7-phosphate isomerase|tara:strand:- start:2535 stop:3122 length:588 start_codon:yes stop_codon:yes gene_type:complete